MINVESVVEFFLIILLIYTIIFSIFILGLVIFQTNIADSIKSNIISFTSLFVLIVINFSLIIIQADRAKKDRKQKISENMVALIENFLEILCKNYDSNTIKKNNLKDTLKKLDKKILFWGTGAIVYEWRKVHVDFEKIIENNVVSLEQKDRMVNFLWLVRKQIGHNDTRRSKEYIKEFLKRYLE